MRATRARTMTSTTVTSFVRLGSRARRKLREVKGVGNVRRDGTPYQGPINTLEKWVLLNLRSTSFVRDPLLGLLDKEAPDEIPSHEAGLGSLWKAQGLPHHVEQRGTVPCPFERGGPME